MKLVYFSCLIFGVVLAESDYYKLLGISRDADDRDIRKAFKILALKLHPDKNLEKESSHEEFLQINKAYEVLKDPDMRKKYDLYGEEGLKEDFGKSWKSQSYQSWNYYYENFGIYDDDKEIVTLNRNDFDQYVFESSDIWFVNFYSPHCSHCHILAPTWRRLAQDFSGVLRFGAVNCDDDFILCRKHYIRSYPSLLMYPKQERYQGSKDYEDLKEYILDNLPSKVIKFHSKNFRDILSTQFVSTSWLIVTCKDSSDCIDSDELKKLGVILDQLVNIAEINPAQDKDICNIFLCDKPLYFYVHMDQHTDFKYKGISLTKTETSELVKEVLQLLPDFEELDKSTFQKMRKELIHPTSTSMLVIFFKSEIRDLPIDIDLKRAKANFPDISFGYFNCHIYPTICSSLYIKKFPTVILFKSGGNYETHYGSMAIFDVTKFLRETSSSRVKTLTSEDFPHIIESGETWIIDFFSPRCAPCMHFFPQWRKSSRLSQAVKFGSIDCITHSSTCRNFNIRSYPTVILYNKTIPHKYHGAHVSEGIQEFIEDVLHPQVVSLSPSTFKKLINMREGPGIWVIDFFAPWCGPCQQLSIQWKKTAKFFNHMPLVHIADVDCEKYSDLCQSEGIQSYPTIRLYRNDKTSSGKFIHYNGRRDSSSLQSWIYQFLPSKVESLEIRSFQNILLDKDPWIVDFFAPWCSHCHTFAPVFEKIAEALEGKVKTGKVNCDENSNVCQIARVNAFPTVIFYKGKKSQTAQDALGEEVDTITYNGIINFLQDKMQLSLNIDMSSTRHDEL